MLKTLVITCYLMAVKRGSSEQALVAMLYMLGHFVLFILVRPLRKASNIWFHGSCLLVQAFSLVLCLILHLQVGAPATAGPIHARTPGPRVSRNVSGTHMRAPCRSV